MGKRNDQKGNYLINSLYSRPMNKNIYILPVSATFRDINYPEPLIRSKESLESKLKNNEFNISLGGLVSPGVYKAKLNGKGAIVKHIENKVPQTPIEFLVMADRYTTEVKVLKRLQNLNEVKAPLILYPFPKLNTFVMEDLSDEGYTSFSGQLLQKKLNKKSASKIGTALATFAVNSRTWEEFKTTESAQLNYYDRSIEMLIAYPSNLERYNRMADIYAQYTEDKEEIEKKKRYFVWPDSTPQNILITKNGDPAFVDFERAYWGDQQIMIAAFIAHVILYSLIGYIKKADTIEYLRDVFKAYKAIDPDISEQTIVEYIAMELLHRSNGKEMDGIKSSEDSLAIQKFARQLLDKGTTSMTGMFTLLKKA